MDTALSSKPTTYEKMFLAASATILVASLVYAYGMNNAQGSLMAGGCNQDSHAVGDTCVKN